MKDLQLGTILLAVSVCMGLIVSLLLAIVLAPAILMGLFIVILYTTFDVLLEDVMNKVVYMMSIVCFLSITVAAMILAAKIQVGWWSYLVGTVFGGV